MLVTDSARLLPPVLAAGGVLLLTTAALWAYYGTAVFYELILAGWAACF